MVKEAIQILTCHNSFLDDKRVQHNVDVDPKFLIHINQPLFLSSARLKRRKGKPDVVF